ncbi:hypothetical protein [Bacillus wiedmannii]|uniref:hypothetical protein n=1 Tax=Bacillus wiedmannii TaxID=1890302 RepID=UPI002E1A2241|nr:hypothetical protein [Bacillus wiedmannii]
MSKYQTIQTELTTAFNLHLAPLGKKFNFTYGTSHNVHRTEIEFKGKDTFDMFALTISDEFEQIHIDTAFLPIEIRGYGIVLRLMEITFLIGQKYGYDTVVVNMVPGFYNALDKRGALKTYNPDGTYNYDALILANTTKL